MKRRYSNDGVWSEGSTYALGAVRLFLAAVSDGHHAKPYLRKLAAGAHEALREVERANKIDPIEPDRMMHP